MSKTATQPLTAAAVLRLLALVVPWLLHLLVADVALSLLLILRPFCPSLVYDWSSSIASGVWKGVQHIFTQSNHARIVVSGADSLPRNGERPGGQQSRRVERLLHDPGSGSTRWNVRTVSLVRKTATEVGALPRLGSVGDGHASGQP